jgi:hypothetical protein
MISQQFIRPQNLGYVYSIGTFDGFNFLQISSQISQLRSNFEYVEIHAILKVLIYCRYIDTPTTAYLTIRYSNPKN